MSSLFTPHILFETTPADSHPRTFSNGLDLIINKYCFTDIRETHLQLPTFKRPVEKLDGVNYRIMWQTKIQIGVVIASKFLFIIIRIAL